MRILLTLSLFLVFNYLPVEAKVSASMGYISQDVDVLEGNTHLPVQPFHYDFQDFNAQDEDTDFNEPPFYNVYSRAKIMFRTYLVVPVFGSKSCSLNLITFGTDSSPPVS